MTFFVLLLASASWLHSQTPIGYQYHAQDRWSGLWVNPNIYGMLMGVGVVLAVGLLVQNSESKIRVPSLGLEGETSNMNRRAWSLLLLTAVGMMSVGLVKSFSRGALLATFCALAYLGWQFRKVFSRKAPSVALPVTVIMLSFAVLAFWQFRHTEQLMVRRAFSVANGNDFSLRNRLMAWEGSLQMMAERPWLGFGWNQSEPAYAQNYRPAQVPDGLAIEMNDFFMLGTTLGLPALLCFTAYVLLTLNGKSKARFQKAENVKRDWLRAVCRTGVIFLLVGFWFDGGLFKMATAAPFWFLLELGREEFYLVMDREDAQLANSDWGNSAWVWTLVIVSTSLLGAILWAKSRDPFERNEFTLTISGQTRMKGLMVLPKPVGPCPVVIYLHGLHESLSNDGVELRQLAELGLAAVGIEYDQTNQTTFDEQFIALHNYLDHQPWAISNATAWVGFSLGSQRTLSFVLRHPEIQPQLLVRLSGGWVNELNQEEQVPNGKMESPSTRAALHSTVPLKFPVLLIHGAKDDVFPVEDAKRLADLLQARGVSVAARVFPGKNHGIDLDRPVVIRLIGEYCRSVLTPTKPLVGTAERWTWPLWVCLIPAMLPAGIWLLARNRRSFAVSGQPKVARAGRERGLRWLAWIMTSFALADTVLHMFVPRLPVNEATLSVARKWLVPVQCREEFEYLATSSVLRSKRLGTLLDCAELANYNRRLVNWQVDDKIYREFVLSPEMDSSSIGEPGWRRPLWQSFYPRIRKEQSPEAAAEIVVRFLRERVTIASHLNLPQLGIESVWKHQITGENGFETIYVAALRSVGIGARLNTSGQAELWTGDRWQNAPRPLASTFL
jgi:O-antigen ligase/dienelactone hydrolase